MLEFLSQGVADYFMWLNLDTLLLLSYLVGTVLPMFLWVAAGFQDWKTHEVSGYVCAAVLALCAVHAAIFSGWFYVLVTAVCAYFTFRSKEIKLIGQADFVMFAHWTTAYMTVQRSGVAIFLIASVIFLIAIFVYTRVYRDKDGNKWRRGMMVPIIPPYTVSVCVMTLIQWPLQRFLFWRGW